MDGFRRVPAIQAITGATLLAWPFLIWFGLTYNKLNWLLPLIALLLIFRLHQTRKKNGSVRLGMQSAALAGIVLCIASSLMKSHQLLLFYPVVINLVLLTVFGSSLWTSVPLVERLARLQQPNLSPAGIRYTLRVTQIWCLFFIGNGVMALLTALNGDIKLWTLWNGLISYILMGSLMAGEWLIRRRVIKRDTV